MLMKTSETGAVSRRTSGFSGAQVFVLFLVCTLLISVPVWTHPLPPISDYINHLARMHVIATISKNPMLAHFYEIDWQIIPNLTMDLIVPQLTRFMSVYVAGEVFIVATFALIISGTLALNRVLIGRWGLLPLAAIPLLYNYNFLVGLMNYIFGIGVSLWALAAWIALRERSWPIRLGISTALVVVLFFCHLSALGIYGVGILSFEILRLWERRAEPWPGRIVDFVVSGLPFAAAVALLLKSPTMSLVSAIYWDQRGKMDGLMYVVSDYSDIVALGLIATALVAAVWAVRHRVLKFHPLVFVLLAVGLVIYIALPRVMFETYMADQRVPLGIVFMLVACGDLELRRRLVRRGFIAVLVLMIGARLIEIDLNWSNLSDTTSEFRSSVRRIAPGSKVFVAYADRSSAGDDIRDLGLVHAACIAMIERSALVTTAFTVVGKQILHVRPEFRDYVDTHDGTPPLMSQLLIEDDGIPAPNTPVFWSNWTKFDYLYLLFTEDDAPNPDPDRLKLVADGDRFQLYKILKPQSQAALIAPQPQQPVLPRKP
ncbi:MAG: hypothetical protein OJF62_001730 [Pseudolabrys sp.]|jgi:hypothetical protein|nr:hypothetical protein [Pseudolabrys sp.]